MEGDMENGIFWLWIVAATILGVATYVGKKMIEEKQRTGVAPPFHDYYKSSQLEFYVMLLTVAGALLISWRLDELTIYAAYMTGIGGGTMAGPTATGAKNVATRMRAGGDTGGCE